MYNWGADFRGDAPGMNAAIRALVRTALVNVIYCKISEFSKNSEICLFDRHLNHCRIHQLTFPHNHQLHSIQAA